MILPLTLSLALTNADAADLDGTTAPLPSSSSTQIELVAAKGPKKGGGPKGGSTSRPGSGNSGPKVGSSSRPGGGVQSGARPSGNAGSGAPSHMPGNHGDAQATRPFPGQSSGPGRVQPGTRPGSSQSGSGAIPQTSNRGELGPGTSSTRPGGSIPQNSGRGELGPGTSSGSNNHSNATRPGTSSGSGGLDSSSATTRPSTSNGNRGDSGQGSQGTRPSTSNGNGNRGDSARPSTGSSSRPSTSSSARPGNGHGARPSTGSSARPSQGANHRRPGTHVRTRHARPYTPVHRAYYSHARPVYRPGVRRNVHWYHGVFVYGPAPRHHHHYHSYSGGQVVVEGSKTKDRPDLPQRSVDRNDTFSVGVTGGSYLTSYDLGAAFSDPGLGLRASYRPVETVGFELGYSYFDQTWDDSSARQTATFQPSMNLYAVPWKRVSPYLNVGATMTRQNYDETINGTEVSVQDTGWGPHVGAGLEFALGERAAVDLRGQYVTNLSGGADQLSKGALQGTVGLGFYF